MKITPLLVANSLRVAIQAASDLAVETGIRHRVEVVPNSRKTCGVPLFLVEEV